MERDDRPVVARRRLPTGGPALNLPSLIGCSFRGPQWAPLTRHEKNVLNEFNKAELGSVFSMNPC